MCESSVLFKVVEFNALGLTSHQKKCTLTLTCGDFKQKEKRIHIERKYREGAWNQYNACQSPEACTGRVLMGIGVLEHM